VEEVKKQQQEDRKKKLTAIGKEKVSDPNAAKLKKIGTGKVTESDIRKGDRDVNKKSAENNRDAARDDKRIKNRDQSKAAQGAGNGKDDSKSVAKSLVKSINLAGLQTAVLLFNSKASGCNFKEVSQALPVEISTDFEVFGIGVAADLASCKFLKFLSSYPIF